MSERAESERQIQPIGYWFIPNTVNLGFVPDEIREQMLNVPLPCRQPFNPGSEPFLSLDADTGIETIRIIEDGIAIEVDDLISSLGLLGRKEASTWWDESDGQQNKCLVFSATEGYAVINNDIERMFPELMQLDELREEGNY